MDRRMLVSLLFFFVAVSFNSVFGAVDGGWSDWSQWSGCADGICAGNQRIRTRTCTNPLPDSDGAFCPGESAEQMDCMINGGFSEWSQWSLCDNPCGGSIVNRTRKCDNPAPSDDGAPCSGDTFQTKLECIFPCPTGPLDGEWGPWGPWTQCPQSCGISGGYVVSRTRLCNQPPPMNNGANCPGNSTESARTCFAACPVDGGFGLWSTWTTCSQTCGTGTQSRSRTCTNPTPADGGQNCTGNYDDAQSCKITSCPGAIDGGWSTWTTWTSCSEPLYCLLGTRSRTRTCTNPPSANGGDDCEGLAKENKDCPTVSEGCTVFKPARPDSVPAEANSYTALECGATVKYSADGSSALNVPATVYTEFSFIEPQLKGGWFAIQLEADDQDDYGVKNLTKVCFEMVDPVTIETLVTNKATYYNNIDPIPQWTKPELTEYVPGITIWIDEDPSLRKYEFQCSKADSYVPHSGFDMTSVRFSYYTEGNSQTFKAKGDHTLSTGTVFDTEVTKDAISLAVYAKGTADAATFQDIMAAFGLSPSSLPDFIVDALKGIGLWDFTMRPAEYVRKLEKNGVYRFTATIDAGGIPVHVEVLAGIRFARAAFGVGFAFDRESYGKLAEKLSGINVDFLNSLGVELEIGISFSPPDETGFPQLLVDAETKFAKEPLHSFVTVSVFQGIFMAAQLVLPKDCSGNIFCEITKMLVGPTAKIYITGEFKWKSIRVATGLANIRLWGDWYFHKMELYVEAVWNATHTHTKLGFRVDVKIPVNGEIYRDGIRAPNNELFLIGVLEYDFTETVVTGKLGMLGMWRKAFTLGWLSIGNIFLGLTYKVGAPVPITGVQFGMRVEFGYDCLTAADFNVDGHCFGGSGYFGVGKPQFFYADMTALTLGKIIRLLGATFSLPPPVAETGFPSGAKVAYSSDDVDLRITGGPFIYKGFELQGKLNILGWEIDAHIKLSETAIFVDLKPDPVDILGVAVIQRSPTNSDDGPWFYVDARQTPPFIEAYIEGYTKLFLISAYVRLNLTMTRMELLIQGSFLELIQAQVFVTASYGFTFSGSSFYVRVIVDLSGINDAIDQAAAAVKAAFDAAQQALQDAQRKVIEAKEECIRKLQLKCDSCKSSKCQKLKNDCKNFLDAAGKWIKNKLAPIGKAIKKVFKGWRKKRQLEQLRNDNFALHLRRRRWVSKILCEGLVGGVCEGVAFLCRVACEAANFITKGLCSVLDVAVVFLRSVEAVTNWVGQAINFVLTQLFRVHAIVFEFSMANYAIGTYKEATFTAGVDLTIFGKRLYLYLSFDLNDPLGSLKIGADKSTEWYKDKMNPQDATGTADNYYDKPNPFGDFDFSERFSIENQQSATDDREGACLYVENKDANSYIKVTGCNETDERQTWAFTRKGQLSNVYSTLCIDTNGVNPGTKLTQTTCTQSDDDQNFECDLTVRSVKRRRANVCWKVGTTSLNGPGSLVHMGSLKCIHPDGGGNSVSDGTKLVIFAGCSESRLEFVLDNGNLKHTLSGKCVQPIGGVTDGVQLGLYSSCGGHQFGFTAGGSLQHVGSGKCVNVKNMDMFPANGDDIVLDSTCENSDLSLVYKQHLTFNFIPTDPFVYLATCNHFEDATLDQRFEVMDDSPFSVCSKYVRNLAAKKHTTQSSTDYNGFSSRAVDENLSTVYNDKSCTHTKRETNPWWRVDLGREYIVTDVIVLNRYEYHDRLKNFEVRVGINEDNLQNPTCHDRVTSVEKGDFANIMCDPPIPGRYVSVQMFGEGILTLCEVMVHSRVGPMADFCQLNNGGCSQVCYNLCNLEVKCDCWPGYSLAYDGRTCIDKDECLSNRGGCDPVNGLCINVPGSYFCACSQGYELKENSLYDCEDKNECNLANAGCEHVCNNTDGSFNCECRKGFQLKSDHYGCEDVDECAAADQGGCDHTCSNYEGGYYCSCNVGYKLMDDDKACEEIYCPELEAPFRGLITPTSCTDDRINIQRGTVCTYDCVSGHYITGGDHSLTCQIDGLWQGNVPYCTPVVCPKLSVPDNGGVLPSSCSLTDTDYGTRCVYYCDEGYQLSGPRYTTCQNDTLWTDLAPVSCVRVYTDPWIACPIDRVETLESDQSTVVLGFKWQLPRTNTENVTVSPSNYDENYPFPVGRHTVTWFGTGDSGAQISCTYHVTVQDLTPPVVSGCPASFTEQTDTLSKAMTWTPPTFTDNVGVASVQSNRDPGFLMDARSSIRIRYTASDASGNTVYCEFVITLEGSTCPTIVSPKNGRVFYLGSTFLQLSCYQNYFFNPPPPGLPAIFQNPKYSCQSGKWVSRNDFVSVLEVSPDCMAYETSDGSTSCPGGKILYDNQICLNCYPGTYSNSTSNACEPCKIGFYQDDEGKQECQPCQQNYSTAFTGAKNESECRPICSTGKYSVNNGVCPCKLCPIGTYQGLEQQTSCKPCPHGTTTKQTGSTSIDDCTSPVVITSTVPDMEVTVTEGESIYLACYIEGKPTPTVTWTYSGGSLPQSRVTITYYHDFDNSLTGVQYAISGAVLSDAGTYECSAVNAYETVTKQVTVNILPIPAPPPDVGSGSGD